MQLFRNGIQQNIRHKLHLITRHEYLNQISLRTRYLGFLSLEASLCQYISQLCNELLFENGPLYKTIHNAEVNTYPAGIGCRYFVQWFNSKSQGIINSKAHYTTIDRLTMYMEFTGWREREIIVMIRKLYHKSYTRILKYHTQVKPTSQLIGSKQVLY